MLNSRAVGTLEVELTDNVLYATYPHTIIANLFPRAYSACSPS